LARQNPPSTSFLRRVRTGIAVGVGAIAISTMAAVPAFASTTHVVKQGETLSEIAHKAGLSSWHKLYNANLNVANPDLILPGQKLVVPGRGDTVKARRAAHRHRSHHHAAKHRARPATPAHHTVKHHANPKHHAAKHHHAKRHAVRHHATRHASSGTTVNGGVWDRIAQCESTGNWHANTGNGFYGGLQLTLSTWHAFGGTGRPDQASKATQIAVAERVQKAQGWGAWPVCSARR
jgi:LysM repeat protein